MPCVTWRLAHSTSTRPAVQGNLLLRGLRRRLCCHAPPGHHKRPQTPAWGVLCWHAFTQSSPPSPDPLPCSLPQENSAIMGAGVHAQIALLRHELAARLLPVRA